MNQTFNIDGMTCNNCKASVEKYLNALPHISHVTIDLAKGEADITMDKHLAAEVLQNALPEKFTVTKKVGGNELTSTNTPEESQKSSKLQQLKPLLLILFVLCILHSLTVYHSKFMSNKYALGYMLFCVVLLIYLYIIFLGPRIGPNTQYSETDLMIQVISQKSIVLSLILSILIQVYGFHALFKKVS